MIAARAGELEQALTLGRRAFSGERKSLLLLLMVSSELTEILGEQYATEPSAVAFLDTVRALGATSNQDHSAS